MKALFVVVDEFKTNGPSTGQVADAQAALRRASKPTAGRTVIS